jgi:hypothetical protein
MVAPKLHRLYYLSLVFLFLFSIGCSAENALIKNNPNIEIDNSVEECFQIKVVKKHIHNNVILLDTEISQVKSTGYCGCKSALLSYYVISSSIKSGNKTKEHRVFSSLTHCLYTFIVENHYLPGTDKSYTINIQCTSPG